MQSLQKRFRTKSSAVESSGKLISTQFALSNVLMIAKFIVQFILNNKNKCKNYNSPIKYLSKNANFYNS